MKSSSTVRTAAAAIFLAAGALAVGAPRAGAQGFGGGSMPPAIQAKIKAWQKWGESHKNLTRLSDLLFQVEQMNEDPGTQLSKPQASKVLAVVKSWRTKTTMNEEQAKGVSKKIGAVLTVKQLKKIATIEPPSARMRRGFGGGRPGGGPGGGGARPGGPGGRPGGFTFPDPPAQGWNPLNPDTLPFERARPMAKQGLDKFVGQLEKQARG